jgi:hypothetical protein
MTREYEPDHSPCFRIVLDAQSVLPRYSRCAGYVAGCAAAKSRKVLKPA